MSEREAHELLKQARIALGVDHATVAQRTGVKEPLLIAIEAGRWDQLPHGLYARAAVRHYAEFLRLDAERIVQAVERLLPSAEDPIAGLARVRGLKPQKAETLETRPAAPEPATTRLIERHRVDESRWPDPRRVWTIVAALVIDGTLIAAPLLVAVAAAAIMNRVPPSALEHGAGAFGVFGALMALVYFLCFAGVAGCTIGERLTGIAEHTSSTRLTLGAVRDRALAAAFRDVRSISALGVRLGRLTLRRVAADGTVDGERLAF